MEITASRTSATWSPPRASPPSSSMPNWRGCARAPTAWPPCWPRRCRGCPIQPHHHRIRPDPARSRLVLVMVDGVPLNTNRDSSRNLANIDPALIERIEVIRGSSAIYGSGATAARSSPSPPVRPAARTARNPPQRHLAADPAGQRCLSGQFQQYFAGSWGRSTIRSTSAPATSALPTTPMATASPGTQPGRPVRLERLQHRRQARPAHRREPARAARLSHYDARQDTDFATDPRVARLPAGSVPPTRSRAWSWTSRTASATPWRTSSTRTSTSSAAGSPRSSTTATTSPASPRSTPAPFPPAAATSTRSCRTAKCSAAA